jgi:acetyl-CoA carboxylase alpha subunit
VPTVACVIRRAAPAARVAIALADKVLMSENAIYT